MTKNNKRRILIDKRKLTHHAAAVRHATTTARQCMSMLLTYSDLETGQPNASVSNKHIPYNSVVFGWFTGTKFGIILSAQLRWIHVKSAPK